MEPRPPHRRVRLLSDGLFAALLLVICCLAGAGAPRAQGAAPDTAPPEAREEPEPLPAQHYQVSFDGPLTDHLRDLLPNVSQLIALQSRPPISRAGLEGRSRRDLSLFQEALRSEGYYEATIDWRIEDPPEAGQPLQVKLTIDPGPLFLIQHFTVEFPADARLDGLKQPDLKEIGIDIGMPARATAVVDAERRFVRYLQDNGYPYAVAGGRKVTVDLATHEMSVTLRMEPGEPAVFGPLAIEGNENVDPDYLREVVAWPEGQRYSATALEQARRRVSATNLYDSVSLTTEEAVRSDGSLPATLSLHERPPRTVGLGVNFTTAYGEKGLGLGGTAFWEHRNLLGRAENLRFELEMSVVLQRLAAIFRKPRFLDPDQSLLLSAEARREDNEAYKEEGLQIFGGVERRLSRYLTLTTGPSFEALNVTGQDPNNLSKNQKFLIYSLPTVLAWDNRDDPFNPTRGVAATATVTPSLATIAETAFYTSVDLTASTYYAPFGDDSMVLAARGRFGTIVGADLSSVPISKRFFAGGGGSVRGYRLYSVGPEDAEGDPTGGLSVFEVNLETRFRFYEDYGLVLFLDGGQVYEDRLPSLNETPLFSAGIGLRYFTALGPIRLDIATPINKRSSDQLVQFYVSIGQSF